MPSFSLGDTTRRSQLAQRNDPVTSSPISKSSSGALFNGMPTPVEVWIVGGCAASDDERGDHADDRDHGEEYEPEGEYRPLGDEAASRGAGTAVALRSEGALAERAHRGALEKRSTAAVAGRRPGTVVSLSI